MNELQKVFVRNDRPVTDSLVVAETFKKNHSHVLRDIKELGCSENFRLSNFGLSSYINNQGKKLPKYYITEQGFTILAMGYTGKEAMHFKEQYIKEFDLMREDLQKRRHQLPQNLPEALRLAADLAEENEKLKPKALFADAVTASKSSVLVGELAKILRQNGVDIGQNRLFDWLRKNGYLCNRGESLNLPTQRAMDLKVCDIKKTTINKPDGSSFVTRTTKITGKGQVYFVNKFLEGGTTP